MKKKYSIGTYKGGYKGLWSKLPEKEKAQALKKQWYVRWAYRNPATDKLERQKNIYANTNQFNTYRERTEVLKILVKNLENLLESGHNPYGTDNLDQSHLTAISAIDKGLEIKRHHMKPGSFTRFKSDINKLKRYLIDHGFENRFISSVTKKEITDFLNDCLKTVSSRTRNNYRVSINTLWETFEDNGIVEKNIVSSIPLLKTKPQRNKTYSDKQAEDIFQYLEKHNTRLLLFIKLVSYNFLRPIEVCRLKAGSFNLPQRTLSVMVKQGVVKTKIIPDLLLNELPSMEDIGPEVDLFGKKDLLTTWDVTDEVKRATFTAAFRKVKESFGLGPEYGIYSFRHYFTTRIYRSLRKTLTPYETKSKLMLITGHDSMEALEKYLRSIDAELPEDYSRLIK